MDRHDPHRVAALLHVALDLLGAGFQPVQEALQRGDMLALVRQGEGEKLLDRIVGLGPQPADQPVASPARAQKLGEELEGAREIHPRPQLAEKLPGRAEGRVLATTAPQFRPEAAPPTMGQGEELLFAEADQRPLEHRGQGQVVLRQQQDPAQRDQIHDRELIGQDHAVDPGHRHVARLELAHQLLDELVAAADQDQDVAGPEPPGPGGQPGLGIFRARVRAGPTPDSPRHQPGQPGARRQRVGALGRRLPGRRFAALVGLRRRPELHQARLADPHRIVTQSLLAEEQAVARARVGEDLIDGAKHGGRGAEGDLKVHFVPAESRRSRPLGEVGALGGEGRRIGALEAVDRLLGIAHRKDRARPLAGARADEKLGGERVDDLPLLRVGILRLVDQDVIESPVQLEEDPGRHPRPRQQVPHLEDQVVVIQQGPRLLVPAIGREDRLAEAKQRGRGLGHRDRAQLGAQIRQALGLAGENLVDTRRGGERVVVNQGLEDVPLAPFREKGAQIVGEAIGPPFGPRQPSRDTRAAIAVGPGALGQAFGGQIEPHEVEGLVGTGLLDQLLPSLAFGDAERRADRRGQAREAAAGAQEPDEPAALPDQLGHELGEALLLDVGGHHVDRRRQVLAPVGLRRRQDLLARGVQHLRRRTLVQDLEVRRHPRLERKAAEQRLTEGVDGLDPHAARRVQDLGEEPARRQSFLFGGRPVE